MTGRTLPPEEVEFIRQGYASGMSVTAMAEALGKTPDAIKSTATRHRIPRSTRGKVEPGSQGLNEMRRAAWARSTAGARKALEAMGL